MNDTQEEVLKSTIRDDFRGFTIIRGPLSFDFEMPPNDINTLYRTGVALSLGRNKKHPLIQKNNLYLPSEEGFYLPNSKITLPGVVVAAQYQSINDTLIPLKIIGGDETIDLQELEQRIPSNYPQVQSCADSFCDKVNSDLRVKDIHGELVKRIIDHGRKAAGELANPRVPKCSQNPLEIMKEYIQN